MFNNIHFYYGLTIIYPDGETKVEFSWETGQYNYGPERNFRKASELGRAF